MKKNTDLTAILPDGREFEFWEEDCKYTRVLYVDGNSTAASDENDGSREAQTGGIQNGRTRARRHLPQGKAPE